ncbi:fructose 1,6-bisphosphatase [Abyssalbus ytuae]|uniref:Fructose 1,6-bisphosphatase n=1 Tax=Abyssalbus ytuae TaxID=2926907 RepID=A0A9E6ZIJ1_9FLAO|nr:fructose 1,6-bisphosphatase [Abyssalbus ytuae]UOB16169.1 fructose 1,6-bisphosphatase [Abyssalbus ytuae]
MSKKEITNPPENGQAHDASSKIEVIKELLFGENIQEYKSEFDKIKEDILKKKNELNNLIEEARGELTQNIDNLSTDLNIRITELENKITDRTDDLDEAKVDRKLLGKLLMDLGEKISAKG